MSIAAVGLTGNSMPGIGTQASANAKIAENGSESFSSVLKSFAMDTVSALHNGEQASIDAIQGKTSIQNAVMATMEAEQSLQAALAIRDKVVSAFLEISRMQI